jgi:peroxiredoxin
MRNPIAVIPALALAATLFAQTPAPAPAVKKAATPTVGTAAPAVKPPRKADEFVIHMVDGTDKLLSSYKGKAVLMAFMYTTCPHCQHTAGLLAKIQTEYAAKGVQIIGVTFDSGAQRGIPGFLQVTGATDFPIGFSTEDLVRKFLHIPGDYYVPMLAFIDRTGMIRSTVISDGDPNSVPDKFLVGQDGDPKTGDKGNIRRELDKLVAAPASAAKAPAKP